MLSAKEGSKMTSRHRVLLVLLLIGIQCLTIGSALAQTRGGAMTIHYAAFSPFIALLAGILILIMPRLLNYIVAVYLILLGLIGLFGV
jgi:peptidoglycan/LPS O-acetylase OafA/YrhL